MVRFAAQTAIAQQLDYKGLTLGPVQSLAHSQNWTKGSVLGSANFALNLTEPTLTSSKFRCEGKPSRSTRERRSSAIEIALVPAKTSFYWIRSFLVFSCLASSTSLVIALLQNINYSKTVSAFRPASEFEISDSGSFWGYVVRIPRASAEHATNMRHGPGSII